MSNLVFTPHLYH